MIEFERKEELILLVYKPINGNIEWIEKELNDSESIIIKQTFIFEKKDLYDLNIEEGYVKFKFANHIEDYFIINGKVLSASFNVYFEKNIELNFEYFRYQHGNRAIIDNYFKIISNIIDEKRDLFIGGKKADISFEEFKEILESFPKKYERDLYSKSRIYQVLENHFDISTNYTEKLENYRNKTKNTISNDNLKQLNFYEIIKYENILKKMNYMLENIDKYSEKQWQKEIAEIITFIFPKYIYCLQEVIIKIKDSNKKREQFDYMLITNTGNVDLLEIKKPSAGDILNQAKDHDNYYASKFLSKTIMQVEKYLYHLNKLGYDAEKNLYSNNQKKFDELNLKDYDIKVINPKGIIILGTNKNDKYKKKDLEIIKKMYSNIIEIISYDDLINRLESTINAIKSR